MATVTIDEVHSSAGVRADDHRLAAMPISRVLRAYAMQIRYEVLNSLRTPAFAIPFLAIPVVVYLLFGVLLVDSSQGAGTSSETGSEGIGEFVNYLFSGFCVMAVMMPGFFSGCMGVALERDGGLLRLRRAWQQSDHAGVEHWNALFLASREAAELRAETVQMGYSLARLLASLATPETPAFATA